jgi:pSer/pThr/pTyr-binding forkhead associated (FHA) protein
MGCDPQEFHLVIYIPAEFDQTVGRDVLADITLPDPAMSSRHARLTHRADGVWLEDLGSANGTFVNGDRVAAPRRLCDGDELRLGNSVAIVQEVAEDLGATLLTTVGGTFSHSR